MLTLFGVALQSCGDIEDFAAVVCVTGIALLGIAANGAAVYLTRTSKALRNPFGRLCAALCISNCVVLSTVVIWMACVLLVNDLSETILHTFIGQVANGMFYSSILIALLIAVNRLYAIVLPLKYGSLCNQRYTTLAVAAIWITAMLLCSIYHLHGCSYRFDRKMYQWGFEGTRCGHILGDFIDHYFSVAVIVLTLGIDFITLLKLIAIRKMADGTHLHKSHISKMKQEGRFFMQSALCTLIHVGGLTLFHVASKHVRSRWALFAVSTVEWIVCHTLVGVILAAFNWRLFQREYRLSVKVVPVNFRRRDANPRKTKATLRKRSSL